MARFGWCFVLGALAVIAAGCGGSSGSVPSGPAVARERCPFNPRRDVLQTCRSPDGRWLLSAQPGRCDTLYFSHGRSAKRLPFYSDAGCGDQNQPGYHPAGGGTWAQPHLLLLGGDTEVFSVDPSTRKPRLLASLNDFLVSPNGEWIAGLGAGEAPDPQALTVYVLSVHGRKCLVVPGQSSDIAGFTPDSRSVIVDRIYSHGKIPLRQFTISSLRAGCPDGVLPPKP